MQKDRLEKRKEFIINTLYIALVAVILFLGITYVAKWLMPFVVGFVIAVIINAFVSTICKKIKINRKFCTIIMLILGYALTLFLIWVLGAKIATSLTDLFSNLPEYYDNSIVPFLKNLRVISKDLTSRISPETIAQITEAIENATGNIRDFILSFSTRMMSAIASASTRVPFYFISLVFTILASVFISLDYSRFVGFIKNQLPPKVSAFISDAKAHLGKTVIGYLKAYIIIWILTFTELSIGLSILRIDNAIGIAALIALADILPIIGSGFVLLPWAVFSLIAGNYFAAIGLVILYLVIIVVRNFTEPKIVGDQLGLNPVVTLFAIYIGYLWLGFAGMILLPVCTTILVGLHKGGKIKLWKD